MMAFAAVVLTASVGIGLLVGAVARAGLPRWPEPTPRVTCIRCGASYLADRGLVMHLASMHPETYGGEA